MKRYGMLIFMAISPLLAAALWMDDQPSHKPYEAPVQAPPSDAVPVTGGKAAEIDAEQKNSVPATTESLANGKRLFQVNCVFCHGANSAELGMVGKRFVPPAPGLAPELIQSRSDSHLFTVITKGFGRMPPFRDRIPVPYRWHVVNYLRVRK